MVPLRPLAEEDAARISERFEASANGASKVMSELILDQARVTSQLSAEGADLAAYAANAAEIDSLCG